MPSVRIDLWKVSTLVLAAALVFVIGGRHVPEAEAASGPVRLTKALSALKSSKKLLEDAKDPPAVFHAQSIAIVSQAIGAVEREIKAYEATLKKGSKDEKKDKEKGEKKKPASAKSAHADAGNEE